MILELRLLRTTLLAKNNTLDKKPNSEMDRNLDKCEGADVKEVMVTDGASSDVHISDVIEVIETDEMFGESTPTPTTAPASRRSRPYVKILEQPASKALRFRYECEGRSAGSIPGVSSSPENKTFPSIQIVGHSGRAVVVVSCVTKDSPYRPHPHNLVGKEGCSRGVCTLRMNSDTISFSNLGIQCVKKKDIEDALRVREEIRVDPFRTGFSHKSQPSSIDLNSVRLCFQVFLEGPQKDEFTIPLRPVVSEPIYDKKAMSDLTICKLSDCSASCSGGKEIILLCEKVAKEDIQVRFYVEVEGEVVWDALGDFQPTHVHKQVAISFRTPKYRDIDIDNPVNAFIQLRRPSDGATSESHPFIFTPLDSDPINGKRKRKFGGETSPQSWLRASHDDDSTHHAVTGFYYHGKGGSTFVGSLSPDHGLQVKREPADGSSPMPYATCGGNLSPIYHPVASPGSSSPHHKTPSPVPLVFLSNPFNIGLQTGGGLVKTAPQPQPQPSTVDFRNIFQEGPSSGSGTLNNINMNNFYGQTQQQLAHPNILHHNKKSDERTVLDMDSQQCSLELSLTSLDSAELARMARNIDANLSENLSSNLTLSDGTERTHDHTMNTDSFSRVAHTALQELVSMGNSESANIFHSPSSPAE